MALMEFAYETPTVEVLGEMEELTGSKGSQQDDGWGWISSIMAE